MSFHFIHFTSHKFVYARCNCYVKYYTATTATRKLIISLWLCDSKSGQLSYFAVCDSARIHWGNSVSLRKWSCDLRLCSLFDSTCRCSSSVGAEGTACSYPSLISRPRPAFHYLQCVKLWCKALQALKAPHTHPLISKVENLVLSSWQIKFKRPPGNPCAGNLQHSTTLKPFTYVQHHIDPRFRTSY